MKPKPLPARQRDLAAEQDELDALDLEGRHPLHLVLTEQDEQDARQDRIRDYAPNPIRSSAA